MIKMEELEHLASLSRIKLDEKDKESLLKEFDSILNYIDQLKNVKSPAEAENRVGMVRNIARQDKVETTSAEDRKRLLDEIPEKVGDSMAVKKIIAQD